MSVVAARVSRKQLWITLPAVMLVAALATLIQSHVVVKLVCIGLFLLMSMLAVALRKIRVVVYSELVLFYLCISGMAIAWAIVGLLHQGTFDQGVFDALKLYLVWSFAYIVLYTFLRAAPSLQSMHLAMVIAGILVPAINFVALYDEFSGLGLVPDDTRQEMELFVGFHEGYIRINSINIGALFLIVPYLLTLQFIPDSNTATGPARLSLVLSLVLAAASGRRALWLVVAMTPYLVLGLALFTGTYASIRTWGRRLLVTYAIVGIAALGMLPLFSQGADDVGYLGHLASAFSSEDERSIQKPYLVEGFLESPALGSGFGGYAGYQRNDERPWTYELTYHRLLFNVGITGVLLMVALFTCYFAVVIGVLRRTKDSAAIPFALLVGFCSLLIGAYSNPYLSSFDYLFFGGLLAYLATFRRGFDSEGPISNSNSYRAKGAMGARKNV